MYKKLLISSGGGIVPANQTSEQSDSNTNIFIGLGGTGKSCLKTIKRDIYTRLQSDDPNSAIKTYKNARFLCIDSDDSGVFGDDNDGGVDALSPQEFYDIGCNDIKAFITNPALKNDPAYEWLKSPVTEEPGKSLNIDDTKNGACGIRQAGRALFFQHAATLLSTFTSMVTSAKQAMPGAKIKIHIFTGIGGGTGAGIFLDVCYLIRKMIDTQKWGEAQVFGYFFLPDVNISNPALNETAREMIKCTGYASMKELDYCMNFANNGDKWKQSYGGFSIETADKPVDYAVLITATDANGVIQPNPYRYAMNVVSTFVMDFLVKQEAEFTIDSVISNFPVLIDHAEKYHGANHGYLVLGASCTYMPFADITTYLTSKLFGKFARINETLPVDSHIDQFLKDLKLNYDGILRELREKVPGVRMCVADPQTLYDQSQGCVTSSQYPAILDTMYKDDLGRLLNQLEANKAALCEKLDRSAVLNTGSARSLINRVFNALIAYATDFNKGPFYASAFLHTVKAKDMKNAIEGMIAENDRRMQLSQGNQRLREDEYGAALNALKNSGKLGRKGKAQKMVEAFHACCNMDAEIMILKAFAEVLTTFKQQVDELYTDYFAKLESVIRELQGTFLANENAFEGTEFAGSEFAVKILSINDGELKKALDDEVEATKIEDFFHNFMECMAKNDDWLTQDENKIVSLVNRHFIAELEAHCQKTTETYLSVKFNTSNPGELQKKIYQNIILPVSANAAPLFWQSVNYQLSKAPSISYCSVPDGAALIENAANEYKAGLPAGSQFQMIPGKDPGRISFLEVRCGIPFFGYQGLSSYKAARGHNGRFIYEGSKRDPRDWGKDYDIIPLSCLGDSEKNDRMQEKEAMLKKAKEYGVFVGRDNARDSVMDFYILQLDAANIDGMIAALDQQIAAKNVEKIKTVLSSVLAPEMVQTILTKLDRNEPEATFFSGDFDQTLKTSYTSVSERYVPFKSTAGYEELCADDIVFTYTGLYGTLEENTNLAAKRYQAIRNAIMAIANLMTQSGMVQGFVNGLCCNVIEKTEADNYTFKCTLQNDFGLGEEVVLNTIESTPYGEHLPLYSAYLAYAALEEDQRQNIKNSARAKKVSSAAEVAEATAKIQKMFTDEANLNSSAKMLQRAKATYALKFEEIKQFVSEFAAELANI